MAKGLAGLATGLAPGLAPGWATRLVKGLAGEWVKEWVIESGLQLELASGSQLVQTSLGCQLGSPWEPV